MLLVVFESGIWVLEVLVVDVVFDQVLQGFVFIDWCVYWYVCEVVVVVFDDVFGFEVQGVIFEVYIGDVIGWGFVGVG